MVYRCGNIYLQGERGSPKKGEQTMTINNIPEYASKYEYIVASIVDDEFWFYGAYENESRAVDAAAFIGGIVVQQ